MMQKGFQHFNSRTFDLGSDSQADAVVSTESLQRKAKQLERQIEALQRHQATQSHALIQQLADILVELNQPKRAWNRAYPVFEIHIRNQQWQQAVIICDTLFRSDHDDALIALGHGLWLSITFPVDVSLTLSQLQHVIDETPEDSDGAAVAAAVAVYVTELRNNTDPQSKDHDDAVLNAGQMLNDVSRRHGSVCNQDQFNTWFEKLELDHPEKFLVRMRNIIDVLVQGQWWIDRSALQALIPQD